MTKTLIQKNIKLSSEFDDYISGNTSAFRRIPKGAHIIITSANDEDTSQANILMACHSRSRKLVEAHKADGKWQIRAFRK